MNILVCVKQVPEPDAYIRIDESGSRVRVDGSPSYRMNRFDECAVELSLLLREEFPGTRVDAITVGPKRCGTVVRRALGMAADHGIHVLTDEEEYVSAVITASLISNAARNRHYDLILTGVMSEDMAHGLTGPMIAEMLSFSCATSCIHVQLDSGLSSAYVEREIEGGRRQMLELSLPAVLTVQSGINKPRYPSLSNIMRANRQDLEVLSVVREENCNLSEKILSFSYPGKNRTGLMLQGSPNDKARQLIAILRERSLLC